MTQYPDKLVEIVRGLTSRHRILRSLSKSLRSNFFVRLLALITFLAFLVGAFLPGWKQAETDFPNYYTAAVLVRQHQPLHSYYDWTWFARQMNYAGNGMQIGAYSPQTPLTMLPMIAVARFPPQTAKQIWLACNLAFLGAAIWMLSQVTRFRFEGIWLLSFCGYFSLQSNFLLGQYYVFLLFLLALAFYCLHRKKHLPGGCIAGIAFGVKLYGGPFLLYFACRRQWKALLGMIAAVLVLVGVAIAMFGTTDVHYYATQLLPRSLEAAQVDPYHPANSTFSAFLLRSLVGEPELNPHPFWQAPWLFFFLRSFTSLAIVASLVLGASRNRTTERHDFAWFVIAVLLLSTSASTYTFIILLLPLILLLEESGPLSSVLLVASYVLLTLPLHAAWLFPKVWPLLALFVWVGWPCWRGMPRRLTLAAIAIVMLISCFIARKRMISYEAEPGQHFEHVAAQTGAVFSSFPVVSRAGIFYESIGGDRYLIRWLHGGQIQPLSFQGQALHPRLAPDGASVDFELVANGTSTMIEFDPSAGRFTTVALPVPADSPVSVASPDGKWLALESSQDGPIHIWVRDLSNGHMRRLTGGDCNSSSPAWELDSKAILFASDCGRAFGMPALYRATVTGLENQAATEQVETP